MLNNEKIILMTKLSLYEQKYQKKEINSSKYFRGDYISLKMISSFICVTIGYLLCLGLWVMCSSGNLLSTLTTTTKFTWMVVIMLVLYVIVTAVYMSFSYAFYSYRFRNMRKRLKEYNGDLKTLHRIQELEYDAIIDELEEEEGGLE